MADPSRRDVLCAIGTGGAGGVRFYEETFTPADLTPRP
jgi:hypothetical protein